MKKYKMILCLLILFLIGCNQDVTDQIDKVDNINHKYIYLIDGGSTIMRIVDYDDIIYRYSLGKIFIKTKRGTITWNGIYLISDHCIDKGVIWCPRLKEEI